VVVGTLNGTVNINGLAYTSNGDRDVFVARFAANNGVKWIKLLGSNKTDDGHGVALDADGNVYVVGSYNGGGASDNVGTFGSKTLTAKHTTYNSFAAKLNGATGNTEWAVSFDGAGGSAGLCTALAVGPGPSVAVGCKMSGDLAYTDSSGSQATRTAGTQDIWIAELDPSNGRVSSGLLLKGTSTESVDTLAFDADKNLYAGGSTKSPSLVGDTPSFTLNTVGSVSAEAAWLIKLGAGANRTHAWSKSYGVSPKSALLAGVAIAPDGSIYATGGFGGTVNFGKGEATSAGTRDTFVLHVDPADGSTLHQTTFGGTDVVVTTTGIAIDDVGNPIVTSQYGGASFTLGSTTLPEALDQSYSSFVAKFTPDLSVLHYVKVAQADAGGVSGARHNAIGTNPKTGESVTVGSLHGTADLGNGAPTTRTGGAYIIRRAR
ncbi:MAG TPA: SBBP repeat-containing protein, partial [Labilithrix sp.]|nr:SBBP repeat-containing protein [Labilithrix sp.]